MNDTEFRWHSDGDRSSTGRRHGWMELRRICSVLVCPTRMSKTGMNGDRTNVATC